MNKPILFNEQMVQAIRKGIKTTTRRVAKDIELTMSKTFKFGNIFYTKKEIIEQLSKIQVGDVLYVRENFYQYGSWKRNNKMKNGKYTFNFIPDESHEIFYCDTVPADDSIINIKPTNGKGGYLKRPSLFMPKELSRIHLKVVDVDLKPIQDMTKEEIYAEGIEPATDDTESSVKNSFKKLWDSTLSKNTTKYSYDNNPLVWVYKFEICNDTDPS